MFRASCASLAVVLSLAAPAAAQGRAGGGGQATGPVPSIEDRTAGTAHIAKADSFRAIVSGDFHQPIIAVGHGAVGEIGDPGQRDALGGHAYGNDLCQLCLRCQGSTGKNGPQNRPQERA